MGTPGSPGTLVCTVVGDVVAPDVGEVEMGTPLQAVIDGVGSGVGAGRRVKAVFSGVANGVVPAEHLGTPLDYESFREIGSGLGSAGFIVYDDTACMLDVARLFSRFLAFESCGQCPACKRGTTEITALLDTVHDGAGTDADVRQVGSWLDKVTDANRCYLPVEEQVVVGSILRTFPEEVVAHLEGGGCPHPRALTLP
jgi:NADH:ubiquinone oxidoreductase subunit F (NADH-binding)